MDDTISSCLESTLKNWRDARRPHEQRMIDWYSDYMRIAREDDTRGSGAAKSRQAKGIFMGSTRNKVRAARAKIVDSLFGANKFPFDTEPANEDLKEWADAFETIIGQQFDDMDAETLIRDGVDELAVYGTGFLFGPFTEQKTRKETRLVHDPMTGAQVAQTAEYAYPCPRYELAQSIEVYPDPGAKDEQKGRGVFWCSLETEDVIKAWKRDPRYKNIDEALLIKGEERQTEGRQWLEQARKNLDFWYDKDTGRLRVARFFGYVSSDMLSPANEVSEGDAQDAQEPVDQQDEDAPTMAIVVGGIVVRIEPLAWDRRPVLRAVYERVPHEMWGVGVAENNAPTQKITNAAVRLFLEGKGHALMPARSVDRSKFLPTEDFKHFPGKVYQFKPGVTPEERKEAIQFHIQPDVTEGWESVIALAERFSDDDTAITKYTQGNDASHLNKTATGISMIMGASSLPTKEVLQNIDSMWIERMVEDLVQWDLEFLEPDHVAMIHGPELAQKWAQIKQYGQSHFMKWKATGATTFMAKEVLLNKLMGFVQMVGATPPFQALVDMRELLEQVWDATQVGRESPILKDEDLTLDKMPPQVQHMVMQLQQAAQMGQQAMQQIPMIQQQADKIVRQLQTENGQLKLALANKAQENQIKAFDAETERIDVVGTQQNDRIETLAGMMSTGPDSGGQ